MEGHSIAPRDLPILFEDNHLLIIDKPAGMLSQGDLSGDLDVLTMAKQMIKARDQKPGNVFLGLVHRLDRPVGGVMVIAKTSKAAGRLSAQFRERTTEKIYLAVVEGIPNHPHAVLTHRLVKDRAARITRVFTDHPEAKTAKLSYTVSGRGPDRSLLEIRLITGVSHQIRAQLSTIGHPIVGDRKYGAQRPFEKGIIALYAKRLTLVHPVTKTPITAEAKPPKNWPFEMNALSLNH
jgi:23S rRNA pseudouridine1911/1915/1917 synthase